MCGFAGILAFIGARTPAHDAIPEPWLDLLEASIAHRGPDGRGRFRDTARRPDGGVTHVALVHRRLSILDHGGGGQPMTSSHGPSPTSADPTPDARVLRGRPGADAAYEPVTGDDLLAVAFNGCIYNHAALRREWQDSAGGGHQFQSDHSDTEVLLHGSRACGAGLADRLDGMYAYAIWSARRATLTLARDPSGEKPLYFTRFARSPITYVAFCSVPTGLLSLRKAAGLANSPDPLGALMWLKHGYWPVLPVVDLVEAEPGATYVFDRDGWPPTPVSRVRTHTPGDPDARLDEQSLAPLLAAAVDSRLDADVPVGCFLSGGVDSSIVAALGQRALAARGRRLRTFNVRMPDSRLDESPYARAVAQHLGTDHVELECRASAGEDLVKLIAQLGLPFGDSSLLSTHWVSAAARAHVTVALGGDGGDELFGGYDRYRVNSLLHRLHGPLALARAIPAWLPAPRLGGNLGRVATAARHAGYDDILTIFRSPQLHALLGEDATRATLARAYADRQSFADARQDDFARYLPLDLMRKVDTAAMAVALEVRAPLLERGLIRAALSAPLSAVYAGEGRKGLLRRVARTLVPPEAIDRKKAGFGVPIGRWFRENFAGLGSLLGDALADSAGLERVGLPVRAADLLALRQEHFAGRRDHGQRLYALLVMSLWARAM